ncbi:hypothetical protein KA005_81530 [bacterium]|nr:hypothetical protein [bacterium]
MEDKQEEIFAGQDLTDEMRIQFSIDEFYEFIKRFDDSNPEHITKILLMRNNLVNMMDTYLKKFNNSLITKDFYERLKKAKDNAITGTKLNKYTQYMNEIRVIQEFKGIEENIAEKLADQVFARCKEGEEMQ